MGHGVVSRFEPRNDAAFWTLLRFGKLVLTVCDMDTSLVLARKSVSTHHPHTISIRSSPCRYELERVPVIGESRKIRTDRSKLLL